MSVNILQAQKEFKKLTYALENPNLKPEDRQKIVVELLDLRGSLVSEFDSVLSMISLTEEKIFLWGLKWHIMSPFGDHSPFCCWFLES